MTDVHEMVASRLRAADQRYTTGRRHLVSVLAGGDGPMTIPQILETAGRLAQSSAYRNLAVLEDVGAVTRIITSDDFARYELAEDLTDDHHHHLICSTCGDVRDFSLGETVETELERVIARPARAAAFTVDHHRLDLVGRCATCA